MRARNRGNRPKGHAGGKRRNDTDADESRVEAAAPEEGPLPYQKKRFLLTKAERSFYLVLLGALPAGYAVFLKVRLADALEVKKGTPRRQRSFNRISAKHLDFLVCDTQWIEPRLAIELDDDSHDEEDRQERDEFLDRACRDGALPLLRVKAAMAYDQGKLARDIASMLPKSTTLPAAPPSTTPTR